MMELGATICLPRAPLCLQCPVFALCHTRGEHKTLPRAAQTSSKSACLLWLRKQGTATEVLLERRSSHASLMPSMYELPPLPMDVVAGREPVLRVRHAITNTNYYVQSFRLAAGPTPSLADAVPTSSSALFWVTTRSLAGASAHRPRAQGAPAAGCDGRPKTRAGLSESRTLAYTSGL